MRNIIKYNNRKLYDKTTKSYTTLAKIRQIIKDGSEVQVTERATGNVVTNQVLFQALSVNDFTNKELFNLLKGVTNEEISSTNNTNT